MTPCAHCAQPIEYDDLARIWYHTGTQYAECDEDAQPGYHGPHASPEATWTP